LPAGDTVDSLRTPKAQGDGVDVVDAGSSVEEGPAEASRLVAGVDVLLAGKEEGSRGRSDLLHRRRRSEHDGDDQLVAFTYGVPRSVLEV
jgi:hypothetical protein